MQKRDRLDDSFAVFQLKQHPHVNGAFTLPPRSSRRCTWGTELFPRSRLNFLKGIEVNGHPPPGRANRSGGFHPPATYHF
jgi:hypothetical protein